jgi:hypothetical protein
MPIAFDTKVRTTAAGIHLENVDLPVLDRVLDVDQTDDVQRLRQRDGVFPHFIDVVLVDQVWRQNTRRVTGVDAGVLDMLHHAADHHAVPI